VALTAHILGRLPRFCPMQRKSLHLSIFISDVLMSLLALIFPVPVELRPIQIISPSISTLRHKPCSIQLTGLFAGNIQAMDIDNDVGCNR